MAGDDITTTTNVTTTYPSPIYREVKAWIAQKEAYELQHNKPAPLTSAQRNALETLRLPSTLLPTVGNTNWVGFLNEYRQATSPSGEIDYMESESGTILAGGTKGRTCRVLVDDMLLRGMAGGCCFPSPGSGLLPVPRTAATADAGAGGRAGAGGAADSRLTIPVFATKKMAKQYAARCAVEFLIQHGYMPDDIRARIERRVAKDEADPEVAAGTTTAVGSVPFPPPGESPPPSSSSSSPAPSPSAQLKRGNDNDVDGDVESGNSGNGVGVVESSNAPDAQHSHPPPSKKRTIAPAAAPGHTTIVPISSTTTTTTTTDLPTAIPTAAPKLVTALCQKLGFPLPRYAISLSPTPSATGGLNHEATPAPITPTATSPPLLSFDGYPEFANGASDQELAALREYATLCGVRAPGADAVKNVVAGKLLVRLQEIEGERRAVLERMRRR